MWQKVSWLCLSSCWLLYALARKTPNRPPNYPDLIDQLRSLGAL